MTKGRPKGYLLDRSAFDALLLEKRLNMTEAAAACDMPLTTLSSLVNGDRKASIKTVRTLEAGLDTEAGRVFPELRSNHRSAHTDATSASLPPPTKDRSAAHTVLASSEPPPDRGEDQ